MESIQTGSDREKTCQSCRWLVRSFLPLNCNEPFFCEKQGKTLAYAVTETHQECWEPRKNEENNKA